MSINRWMDKEVVHIYSGIFSSVQLLSHVQLFVTPRTAEFQVSLSITSSQSLLKLMSIKSVMPFNHLNLCYPLLLLPSIFPSVRVFPNESVLLIKWPKYWSFSFNMSPSKEQSGLISLGWTGWISLYWLLKKNVYLFGCAGSSLQHAKLVATCGI